MVSFPHLKLNDLFTVHDWNVIGVYNIVDNYWLSTKNIAQS